MSVDSGSPSEGAPLVLVSNRGPVTYQEDGSVRRGTGGLVTALTGLASHRDAIWIASAMTDRDVEVAEAHGGRPFEVEAPHGGVFRVRFVASDAEAYDRFYNVFANPVLWFIQHYLWDLSNAPDIRRHEVAAFYEGYNVVNQDLARRGARGDQRPRRAGRDGPRLPPLHAARDAPPRARRRLPASLRPHPVDPAGRLARAADPDPRRASTGGCWPTTSSASTPAPTGATSCTAAATCSASRSTWSAAWWSTTSARRGCGPIRCRSTTGRRRRSPRASAAPTGGAAFIVEVSVAVFVVIVRCGHARPERRSGQRIAVLTLAVTAGVSRRWWARLGLEAIWARSAPDPGLYRARSTVCIRRRRLCVPDRPVRVGRTAAASPPRSAGR